MFNTTVVVDEDRYKKLKICNWEPQLFTTQATDDSFLFVRNCTELGQKPTFDPDNTTMLVLTAWKNKYKSTFKNFFRAGYSSHSNSFEIEAFVKSVMPKRISFHSHSDEPAAVRFQNHLLKEYTLENEYKLYSCINTLT